MYGVQFVNPNTEGEGMGTEIDVGALDPDAADEGAGAAHGRGPADQNGIESLSMRKLAQALDVVPMALYRHVANKDELLNALVDVVIGEIDPPLSGVDWRTAMRGGSSRPGARSSAIRGHRARWSRAPRPRRSCSPTWTR